MFETEFTSTMTVWQHKDDETPTPQTLNWDHLQRKQRGNLNEWQRMGRTANMCAIIMPFAFSTIIHRMWVWGRSRYNFSDFLPETWSYTSIKTKLGMSESSQHIWISTSLAFALRINGRGIRLQWRPCVPLSIWLRSTAQPSIHSCWGELEQTLTMQLPKDWDILKGADCENKQQHRRWKPSSDACPIKSKSCLQRQLVKARFRKLSNTLGLTIRILFMYVRSGQ